MFVYWQIVVIAEAPSKDFMWYILPWWLLGITGGGGVENRGLVRVAIAVTSIAISYSIANIANACMVYGQLGHDFELDSWLHSKQSINGPKNWAPCG